MTQFPSLSSYPYGLGASKSTPVGCFFVLGFSSRFLLPWCNSSCAERAACLLLITCTSANTEEQNKFQRH